MTDLRCASGVVRRPTALGPEAGHLGLDKRLARASERGAERAHELERRGRPGPLAAATIQAPRGLETSAVALAANGLKTLGIPSKKQAGLALFVGKSGNREAAKSVRKRVLSPIQAANVQAA